MNLKNYIKLIIIAASGAILAGSTKAAEPAPFPSSNAPARIEMDPARQNITVSNPSPFGKLTSKRWIYGNSYERESLAPVANPNGAPEPQPRRDHPSDVEISLDGTKAYVALQGSELEPGSEIAVIDLALRKVIKRVELKKNGVTGVAGSSPFRIIPHPAGRHLFIINRFSNFASILDTVSDEIVEEVALDFYLQDGIFNSSGDTLFLASRYLDQVFLVKNKGTGSNFSSEMTVLGGIDEDAFFKSQNEIHSVHSVLKQNCGMNGCHDESRGNFYAGKNAKLSYFTTLQHVKPGKPMESRLLMATVPGHLGGYADMSPKYQSHAMGTVVFRDRENKNFQRIKNWIAKARPGPGIPVGNVRSKPIACVLTSDGKYLFSGNTGTQDISIIDTTMQAEVGGIYLQNAPIDLVIYQSEKTGKDYLIVTTLGIGFGVTKDRDPFGGESWDTNNPAAQYSVWRDPSTGLPLPREEQEILGPFDAVDGTLEIKFRDIQNDILFIDISKLGIPENIPKDGLEYILMANKYEAHSGWVRYTSDTAESTFGDIKGDIPPALMRVVGAYPDQMLISDNKLFVTMQGSNLVQEWTIQPEASDPVNFLVPQKTYPTGMMPKGITEGKSGTISEGLILVSNFLGGTVSVINRKTKSSNEIIVDPSVLQLPVPVTNAERGEIMAHTSFYSSDGDTSCIHCHTQDMGDGRSWGVSQVLGQEFLNDTAQTGPIMIGGAMNVPQMRGLFAIQPFFFEGVISGYEPRSMMMEHCPADDFKAPTPQGDFTEIGAHYTMSGQDDIQSKMDTSTEFKVNQEERRDEMFRSLSREQFGKSFNLRDFQRFIGEWQMHEPRLLPNPFDQENPSVVRGKLLFEDPQVGCSSCHVAPHFTKKDFPDNPQQAIPPVVMFTVRDGSFTLLGKNREDFNNRKKRDLESWDQGRAETKQGHMTTFPLRGIWDRPPVFLHNGVARTLLEVCATPGHPGLTTFKYEPLFGGYPERPNRKEVGFNMTFVFAKAENRVKLHRIAESRLGFDTHGGTSHLTRQQIEDLVNFLNSIE